MKKLLLFILTAGSLSAAVAGPVLPHADLVNKYLRGSDMYGPEANSCKGIYMMPDDDNLECWAAHVAKDLSAMQVDTRDLVLNTEKRDAVLSRCQALSMKARFDSRECAAAVQADSFVSMRLPRMKLEAVKFK
jgi:hypothetical protein